MPNLRPVVVDLPTSCVDNVDDVDHSLKPISTLNRSLASILEMLKEQLNPPAVSTPKASSKAPVKHLSGLPPQKENIHGASNDNDIHMNTAKGLNHALSIPDIRMSTAKGNLTLKDIHMETVVGDSTLKQGGALQLWERELLGSPEVKRKSTVAQLCEFLLLALLFTVFLLRLVEIKFLMAMRCIHDRFLGLLFSCARLYCCPKGA